MDCLGVCDDTYSLTLESVSFITNDCIDSLLAQHSLELSTHIVADYEDPSLLTGEGSCRGFLDYYDIALVNVRIPFEDFLIPDLLQRTWTHDQHRPVVLVDIGYCHSLDSLA